VSYVGELGWELHCESQYALALFDALYHKGQNCGIGLYGAFAANSMRLEKGYRAWGADLTTERTPLESGLDHLVSIGDRDFIGAEAMQSRSRADEGWEMLLLQLDQPLLLEDKRLADPFYSHCIYHNGKPVGLVSSAAWGHRVSAALALGWMRERGLRDELEIDVLGNRCTVTVMSAAPYDPHNILVRA